MLQFLKNYKGYKMLKLKTKSAREKLATLEKNADYFCGIDREVFLFIGIRKLKHEEKYKRKVFTIEIKDILIFLEKKEIKITLDELKETLIKICDRENYHNYELPVFLVFEPLQNINNFLPNIEKMK